MRSFYYNFINEYGTREFLDATPCVAYAFEIGRFLYTVNVTVETFNEALKSVGVVDADKESCEKALKGGAPAVRMNGFIGSYDFRILKNIIKSAILLEFEKNEKFMKNIIEASSIKVFDFDKRLLECFEEGTELLCVKGAIDALTRYNETPEADWFVESELFPKYKEQGVPYCIEKFNDLSQGYLHVKVDNIKEEVRRIIEEFLDWA
jgi:hypothetical protein